MVKLSMLAAGMSLIFAAVSVVEVSAAEPSQKKTGTNTAYQATGANPGATENKDLKSVSSDPALSSSPPANNNTDAVSYPGSGYVTSNRSGL